MPSFRHLPILVALCVATSLPAHLPAQGSGDPGQKGAPAAGAPQRAVQQPGNTWFEVTDQDLGTFYGEGEATGTFRFKNPNDQPIEWRNLNGSCQCLRAVIRAGDRRYELRPKQSNPLVRITSGPGGKEIQEPVTQIQIGPSEEGEVEVHLDMHNITGPKLATLDIHTTDTKLPHMRLKWTATGAKLFVISPSEVNLNKMTWSESRDFTVTVASPLNKDFNITRMDDAGKAFDVSWEKSVNNGLATWTIKGRYGPVDQETGGGGVLRFHTDIPGNQAFSVRVMAFVQGPLEVKPGGFLTLGMIRKGSTLHKEIVFEPNDGADLALTGFRFEKLAAADGFLKVTSKKDGLKLVVDLEVTEKAPQGLLKGDLVIELNHPLVKEKRIMFNGFVR
jgi:hypothetical protein